jgi:FkbM family methyltransferase
MLIPYELGGMSLLIRAELAQAEQMIVREVQTAYAWDFPIERALDVGAHIGAWTCYAKYKYPAAQIAALEVDSANLAILRRNTQALADVSVVEALCGYQSGAYEVARHAYNSGSTRVILPHERATYLEYPHIWTLYPAPALQTLEAEIGRRGWQSIDTLKLDCEGSEVDIITHMLDSTLAGLRHIIGEIHTYPDVFAAQTHNRLARSGFQVVYTPHPANPQLHTFHAYR